MRPADIVTELHRGHDLSVEARKRRPLRELVAAQTKKGGK